jgi:branched-chain amino acid transport system permease protein
LTLLAFVQVILGGLATGCVYGLVALSFVLIYKASESVSFMQGDLLMMGAFIAVLLNRLAHWPLGFSMLASVVLVALLMLVLERGLLSHTIGKGHVMPLLMSFGLGLMIRGTLSLHPEATHSLHTLDWPHSLTLLSLGPLVIPAAHLWVMGLTLLSVALLAFFFHRTRTGLALRAYAESSQMASLMGISPRRMNALCWGLGAVLAALAGLLLAPITFVHLGMSEIAMKAFPAAVLGGMSSFPGALLGGLFLGVLESVCGLFLPDAVKNGVPYAVLLLALLFFPQGLGAAFSRTESAR